MSDHFLHVGGVFHHPDHGIIYITDGAYSQNGRFSNAWSWRKVGPRGALSRQTFNGYGGDWPSVQGAKVEITVTITLPKKGKLPRSLVIQK